MAEAMRRGQWFVLQLDCCYPFLGLGLRNSYLSLSLSDPKQVMLCKDSGQLVIS